MSSLFCVFCILGAIFISTNLNLHFATFFSTEFYRQLSFTTLTCIPSYYIISQRPQDGLLLIRYVNQGEPFSHTLSAYMRRYVNETSACRLVSRLCQGLGQWWTEVILGLLSRPRTSKFYP